MPPIFREEAYALWLVLMIVTFVIVMVALIVSWQQIWWQIPALVLGAVLLGGVIFRPWRHFIPQNAFIGAEKNLAIIGSVLWVIMLAGSCLCLAFVVPAYRRHQRHIRRHGGRRR